MTSTSLPNKTDLLIPYQCTETDNIFVTGKSPAETENYFIINSNTFYPGFSLLYHKLKRYYDIYSRDK